MWLGGAVVNTVSYSLFRRRGSSNGDGRRARGWRAGSVLQMLCSAGEAWGLVLGFGDKQAASHFREPRAEPPGLQASAAGNPVRTDME